MKHIPLLILSLLMLSACTRQPAQTEPAVVPTEPVAIETEPAAVATDTAQAYLPNPASEYCEQQGYTLEIRTAEDGSQTGYCIFDDGSECDEWAYYRGECGPSNQAPSSTEFPTVVPIDPSEYNQGWITYTHPLYGFSIMLPEDWTVEEVANDPLLKDHLLNLVGEGMSIRMTFRHNGEEVLLWPTGVGQGEFVPQGTLDVAGEPAQRVLLICPTGEITSIWYHGGENQPNITRSDLEFGLIFSAGDHCEPGRSLEGKIQRVGEMIIASLQVP